MPDVEILGEAVEEEEWGVGVRAGVQAVDCDVGGGGDGDGCEGGGIHGGKGRFEESSAVKCLTGLIMVVTWW